ncbi:hypothetical protein ACTMU2_01440 [Cupriavidus basilensis]
MLGSYIQNAKVCIDLNDNGKCDTSEPSATTDSKGKFSIGDTTSGNWKNLVADLTNARENDVNGDDMGVRFGSGAFFLAPKGASGTVSAITTQLALLVAGGATLSDAKTMLAARYGGVSTDKLLADFNTDSSLASVKTASDNYIKSVVGAESSSPRLRDHDGEQELRRSRSARLKLPVTRLRISSPSPRRARC